MGAIETGMQAIFLPMGRYNCKFEAGIVSNKSRSSAVIKTGGSWLDILKSKPKICTEAPTIKPASDNPKYIAPQQRKFVNI